MKIPLLFNPYIPLKKCGADPVSAAIMAGANVVNGIMGNSNEKKSRDLNYRMFREGNSFQHSENALARQSAFDMQRVAHLNNMSEQENAAMLEFRNWKNEFDLQNEYNDPSAQVARLGKAGLNPAAYMASQGANIGAANPSSGSVGVGNSSQNSPSPLGSISAPYIATSSSSSMLDSVSKVMNTLSNVSLQGAQKEEILRKLQPAIEQIQAITANQNAQARLTGLKADFEAAYGDDFWQTEIGKNFSAQVMQYSMADNYDADTALKQVQKLFTEDKREQAGIMFPHLLNETIEMINYYREMWQKLKEEKDVVKPLARAQQKRDLAAANESNANASLARANTDTTNQLREYIVNDAKFKSKLTEIEHGYESGVKEYKLEKLKDDINTELMKNGATKAQANEAMQVVNDYLDKRRKSSLYRNYDDLIHRITGILHINVSN